MSFCTNCGKPYHGQPKFCQSCGMPLEPEIGSVTAPPPPMPAYPNQPVPGEMVGSIVPGLLMNNAKGTKDTYYVFITGSRSIFAKITSQVAQSAMQMKKDAQQAKGMGVFGRWKDQVAGPNMYLERYKTMTPGQILAESAENFAIENSQIQMVRYKFYFRDEDPSEWYLEFLHSGGIFKFSTQSDPEKPLKQAFGAKFVKIK
jgi:hypothetical protein